MSDWAPPLRVVVSGRDADLWLCANALNRALGPTGVETIAIELPTRLRASDISASLPPLEAFHAKLEISEASLLRATGGSFSLGQNIVAEGAPAFFHAWGTYGAPVDGSEFFPCWLKARSQGLRLPLHSFCLTAVAAQNGRMLLPDETTAAFGRTDYGYHLPALPYVGYLKSLAAARGVRIHETQKVHVERAREDGSIAALIIDGSQRIEGELFVDATGEEALLIGRSLGVPRESWRQYFGVDRVLTARAPAFTSIPPFAELRASHTGWTALHPTRGATGVVHAYSQALTNDDAALRSATSLSSIRLTDPSFHSIVPGVCTRMWEANCVALGRAACLLDPLHNVDLHVLQLGIVHLLSLFPVAGRFAAERTEYNRHMRSYYERIRDFQCALYALAPVTGEFWQQSRGRPIPQSLSHKIDTFRACGEIAPMEDESFSDQSWQATLAGLGVIPESWSPATDRIAPHRVPEAINRMLRLIKAKVLEQPTHDEYLESVCSAVSP